MVNEAPIRKATLLAEPNVEAREHEGTMWRLDFADAENSSAYISADTGRFLVMRGDCQHRDKNGPGTGLKRGQLG
jgi:valyl-tRNA synthetase